MEDKKDDYLQTATFAAGCFWGVEDRFSNAPGVEETAVGYMGGHLDDPTYEDVCTDKSGHAEVVQLKFDPQKTSYEELLAIFWQTHDPTTPNRQGEDIGTQYRSGIYFHTPQQQKIARQSLKEMDSSNEFKDAIVTEIKPTEKFWPAEEYHQKYYVKNPHKKIC